MARTIARIAALAALLALPLSASDLTTNEDARLVPNGLLGEDFAGQAVDIDGDTLVIGATGHASVGNNSGAVFVFRQVAGLWTQEAKLVGSLTAPGDTFGASVAIEDERIVVGAPWKFLNGQTGVGEAYVFDRIGGSWQEAGRLIASNGDEDDYFGTDVALDGDTVVVGAYGTRSWRGSAYVFELQTGSWVQTAELGPSHGGTNQLFGESVDISGNAIVVGAPWMDISDPSSIDRPGAAYVYRRSGNLWVEEAALAGDGPNSWLGPNWMGESVAIDGDTVVAGSPRSGNPNGTAFVFERVAGVWGQTAQLTSSFWGLTWSGQEVDLQGDLIVLGAPLSEPTELDLRTGAATLWQRQSAGWSERRLLLPNTMLGEGQMGYGIGLDGQHVVSGAMFENSAGLYTGAAYVFTVGLSDGETFCFGDGEGTSCPCNWNNFTPGNGGCVNGGNKGGLLLGVGTSSVTLDDMELVAANLLPGKPALLFHGTAEVNGGLGNPFGNGLLCAGGNISRVSVEIPDAEGFAAWGPGLAASEGLNLGDTPRYQVWYRDPNHYCDGGFNFSNAYRVTMTN